jgi:GTP-binding protein
LKFIDEATISVQSGDGGRGCVSFRRERFIPRGGPDGGDGGKGGDVLLLATSRKRTLHHFKYQHSFKAANGAGGEGAQKTGKNGADLVIELPPGTLVYDARTGELLRDLTADGENFRVARGGRGGRGNKRFATATNRAPRFAQPGEPGEAHQLKLELKLLADVGIIGLPNAGKSTLIGAISAARPKTGSYPFTTLEPNLGVVTTDWGAPFVVADIPGLIEGAHQGAGLGIQFLRHIERTRLLVHLIDAGTIDSRQPLRDYHAINAELRSYKPELAAKPQIVVLNKLDLPEAKQKAADFQQALPEIEIVCISAVTGEGLPALKSKVVCLLDKCDEQLP